MSIRRIPKGTVAFAIALAEVRLSDELAAAAKAREVARAFDTRIDGPRFRSDALASLRGK